MDPSPAVPALQLFSLKGQNVLITGATRGIGAACAIALAEAGASIFLVQRHSDEPNLATYNAIKALLENDEPANKRVVEVIHCDLDNLEEVKGLFDSALEVVPGKEIHVLVNCAGIQRRAPAVEFGEKEWDEVLDVNLKSVWLLSQAAGRHMVPRRQGKIINFCSLLTFQGGLTVPAYAAAKGALGQLTKALANEWSKENVQVNGICPGYVKTDITNAVVQSYLFPWCTREKVTRYLQFRHFEQVLICHDHSVVWNEKLLADPTRLRQISERIPAGRWAEPRDFAGPIVFLASQASHYVCGELLVVDGGWMGR